MYIFLMFKVIMSVLLFLLTSCAEPIEQREEFKLKHADTGIEHSVWVCHNPGSKLHGKICTPECLEDGNNHKFCWLLHEDDCIDTDFEWQEENCHLINR